LRIVTIANQENRRLQRELRRLQGYLPESNRQQQQQQPSMEDNQEDEEQVEDPQDNGGDEEQDADEEVDEEEQEIQEGAMDILQYMQDTLRLSNLVSTAL
jgi:hypothetical protein